MKRFFHNLLAVTLIAVISLSFVGCNNEDDPAPTTAAEQTLIFYFAGTDLTFYFYKNISAIKDALREDIKGGSRVMLFFQQSEKNSAEIIELTYNNGLCEEKKMAKYDLPEYMDAEHLGYYLSEVMRLAPASTYSLIIGSHGLGWIPIGATPDGPAATLRSTPEDDFWKQTGDITTRFIGEASNIQNAFNISTLSEALTLTGEQMEYILFDACFMANVESAYVLRNNAKYIVGSVCEIMGDGFPYTNIVPHLLKNYGTSYDLDLVCQEFHTYYLNSRGYSGSISLIDCSELDALAEQMKRVNQGTTLDYALSDIQFYEGQSRHVFFDLGDYVNHFCGDEALKADFKAQLDKTVVKRYTLNKFYSAYGSFGGTYKIDVDAYSGLNTSAPAEVYQHYYTQTDWYKATH